MGTEARLIFRLFQSPGHEILCRRSQADDYQVLIRLAESAMPTSPPVAHFLSRFQDLRQRKLSDPCYEPITSSSTPQDQTRSGNWIACWRNVMVGILFVALVIGGANSCLYPNQKCGACKYFQPSEHLMTNVIEDGPLPSLYDADIDTLAKGLACGEFTSVDLIRASHFGLFLIRPRNSPSSTPILPESMESTMT
ncbi:putative glutamyl-trna amidotransferase subunit a protein [Ilyonectria robusta]